MNSEFLKAIGVVQERICNCGSCRDAAEAALRQFEQLSENQCPAWIWQIGFVLVALSRAAVHEEFGEEAAQELSIYGMASLQEVLRQMALEEEAKSATKN